MAGNVKGDINLNVVRIRIMCLHIILMQRVSK